MSKNQMTHEQMQTAIESLESRVNALESLTRQTQADAKAGADTVLGKYEGEFMHSNDSTFLVRYRLTGSRVEAYYPYNKQNSWLVSSMSVERFKSLVDSGELVRV